MEYFSSECLVECQHLQHLQLRLVMMTISARVDLLEKSVYIVLLRMRTYYPYCRPCEAQQIDGTLWEVNA